MTNHLLSRGAFACICLLLASCMQAEAQNCSIVQRQWNSGSSYLITRSPTADRCEQFLFGTSLYKGVHTIKIEGYIMDCSPNFPNNHNVLVFSSNMTLLHDYCKEARLNNTNTTSISVNGDYGLIVQQRSRKNNLVFTRISYSFQYAPQPNGSNSTNSTLYNSTNPALYGCGVQPPKPVVSNARVIGGLSAANNAWPWMAYYGCGGVIISDRWVLTVAHCLYEPMHANQTNQTNHTDYSQLKIFAGGNDINNMPVYFNVSKVVLHQKFNPSSSHDDIALIQLEKPIVFSSNVQPICLPPYDLNRVDRQVILTGWGAVNVTMNNNVTNYTETNILKQVTLPIRNILDCSSSLGMNLDPSSQICAGVYSSNSSMIKSACQGDSGSPIVFQFATEYYLAGLTSDGDPSCNGNGFFTNVWFYMNWIRSTMENS